MKSREGVKTLGIATYIPADAGIFPKRGKRESGGIFAWMKGGKRYYVHTAGGKNTK